MHGLIPLILIFFSIGTLIALIIRKFPQLVLLDVTSLPEVKEQAKREIFLRKRALGRTKGKGIEWQLYIRPLMKLMKEWQFSFRKYVGKIERRALAFTRKRIKIEAPEEKIKKRQQARTRIQDAVGAAEAGDFNTAEQGYLAAVKADPKNKEAYRGLAEVYRKQGQFAEAKETYQFVLHLDSHDEEALTKLAEIAESEGKLEQAVEYYQQLVLINDSIATRFAKLFELLYQLGHYDIALEAVKQALSLEPENPKYLDNLIEVSILVGDKITAEEGYRQLRMVNPDNQKLASFRQRIEEMKK